MTLKKSPATIKVPPSRLAPREWSHDLNRQIGEGDIHASYSADRIAMSNAVRRPFLHAGSRWVCIGIGVNYSVQAYQLVHPSAFRGTPTTYGAQVALNQGDDALADPMGFYHGMSVRSGGETLVLCGLPVHFVPGEEPQRSLFD
jgi:hypothetical protein